MTIATGSTSGAQARPDDPRSVRRAVFASTIGAGIEWYDFMLYGAAAALIFPKLYFPDANPTAGLLLAFSTYFVGFAARPIGAAIFGHIGDRMGRKYSLMATILLMGFGTVGIGLVPSFDSIGLMAPLLLVALRCLQGIGVGGEWGGAVLLAMESGDTKKQGFRSSFPQAAATVGVGAANLAFLAVSLSMPTEAFQSWGWRIPFIASAVLVIVGLWMRNAVPETSAFQRARDSGSLSRTPVLDVIRRSPIEIILAALMKAAEMIPVYVFIAFILAYGTENLSYTRDSLLLLVSISALLASVAMVYVGHHSDKLGYERTFIAGASVMAVFGFVYFLVIDTGSLVGASIVILISLIPYAIMFAPQPVLIARNFPAETRYSGASLGFNIAGIVGGGPAPFIATWLVINFGSMAVAVYIAIFCLIGIAATKALTHRGRTRAAATDPAENARTAPRSPETDNVPAT